MFDLSTCGVRLTPLLMTLTIFGCSNVRLLVKLKSGMLIRLHPIIPPLRLLPRIFYLTSSFPFLMTLVLKSWLLSVNRLRPAYPTISRNGEEERAYVEPLPSKTVSTWTSFSDPFFPLSAKMLHLISPKLKNLLSRLRWNMTWYMHTLVMFIPSYLISLDLVVPTHQRHPILPKISLEPFLISTLILP